MFRLFVIFGIIVTSSSALDLKEAIERALKYNPLIKEELANYKASQSSTLSVKAAMLPSLDLAYTYDSYSIPNFVGEKASSSASATLSYNLFNGFKDSASGESALALQNYQLHHTKGIKEDIKLKVSLAYIDYLRMIKEIEIAQDTLRLLDRQYEDAQNFQAQGLLAKNESLQVNVERLNAEQTLMEAKRNLNMAHLTLKKLLGGDLDLTETIMPLDYKEHKIKSDSLEDVMYQNRSELKAIEFQKAALVHQYEALNANYYPAVDMKVKYQAAGNDVIPDGGRAFLRNDEKSFGVSMKWNLYEGGKTQEDKAALLYQSQALSEAENAMRLQLQWQLSFALQSYTLSRSQISVAQTGLDQAKENYRIVYEQFQESIASTTLLLEAQKLLTRARVSYAKAFFAAYDAMVTIERVSEKEIFEFAHRE